MSLTADDLRDFTAADPDDEAVPLGDTLAELAVDVEIDSVEAVRDVRERLRGCVWTRTSSSRR